MFLQFLGMVTNADLKKLQRDIVIFISDPAAFLFLALLIAPSNNKTSSCVFVAYRKFLYRYRKVEKISGLNMGKTLFAFKKHEIEIMEPAKLKRLLQTRHQSKRELFSKGRSFIK